MTYLKKFKAIFTLAIIALSFSNLNAQALFNMQNISASMGAEQEILRGLSAKSITEQVRGDLNFDYDNMEFGKEDIYSMACENPTFRIGTTIPVKGTGLSLYLGVNAIWDRYDGAFYQSGQGEDRSTLHFESRSNEVSLETSLLKKIELPLFNVYVGAGTNVGYSFGGVANISGNNVKMTEAGDIKKGETPGEVMNTIEHFYDSYQLKNSLHQRVFLQGGVGVRIFNRLELGLEGKFGYGYRLTRGTKVQGTELTSVGANVKFLF